MLTEKEIENLKKKLEAEQKDLVAELNGLQKPEAIDMGSETADSQDEEADEAEEEVTDIAMAQPLKERLEGIKMTLFKIEQGKYGFCEKCGAEIEKEILEIDPESRWCKVCKLEAKV
ncbi:MAG: hypothetical protein AAB847_02200 [Patescibacteria group bacterium]